jgi:hypothetical protein
LLVAPGQPARSMIGAKLTHTHVPQDHVVHVVPFLFSPNSTSYVCVPTLMAMEPLEKKLPAQLLLEITDTLVIRE